MTPEELQQTQQQLSNLEKKIDALKKKILGEVEKRADIKNWLIILGIAYALKKPIWIIGSYVAYTWLKGRATAAEA